MTKLICAMSAAFVCIGMSGSAFSQITGNVTLQGQPPVMPPIKAIANDSNCGKLHKDPVLEETVVAGPKGELQNVVVSIKMNAPANKAQVPQKAVVLDQKGCVYQPHVIACMVGQEIDVLNSDKCQHNVHGLCFNNDPFNFASGPGQKKIAHYDLPENFKVKCEVHPWMSAWICVINNPYFAVTDADGVYSIDTKGLSDGQYTLTFWQERFGEHDQKVTLKDGKGTADYQFK